MSQITRAIAPVARLALLMAQSATLEAAQLPQRPPPAPATMGAAGHREVVGGGLSRDACQG